jgi:hypothetical protein
MRGGLWPVRLACVVLGVAGCTQEVALPVSAASSVDNAPDASVPARWRHRDGGERPTPDDVAPSNDADAAVTEADASPWPDPDSCVMLDQPVRRHHAKLVIALDRSTSMFRKTGGAPSRIEWTESVLHDLFTRYGNVIYFGYEEFPISGKAPECGGAACCAGGVVVPPAAGTQAQIEQRWACTNQPTWCHDNFSESPSYDALGNVAAYYDTASSSDLGPGPRYVLLLTDHDPWCATVPAKMACPRAIAQIMALRAEFPAVKTLVFGLSMDVSMSLCLSEMAHVGLLGRGPNQFPSHYVALTKDDLEQQLGDQLAGFAQSSCTFSLDQEIPAWHTLSVALDGRLVPHDPDNGWDWDSNVHFWLNGAACDQLLASANPDLAVADCMK